MREGKENYNINRNYYCAPYYSQIVKKAPALSDDFCGEELNEDLRFGQKGRFENEDLSAINVSQDYSHLAPASIIDHGEVV